MYAKEIKVDRQSICMADDVAAPNEGVIEVTKQDALIDVMVKVAAYLPQIDDSVWAADSGREVIGNAQKVLWVWYAYGRAQVYEN